MDVYELFKADVKANSTILNKIKTDLDYCEKFYLTLCYSDFENASGVFFKSRYYKNANIITDLRELGEIPTILYPPDPYPQSDSGIISEITSLGWTVVPSIQEKEISEDPVEDLVDEESVIISEDPEAVGLSEYLYKKHYD